MGELFELSHEAETVPTIDYRLTLSCGSLDGAPSALICLIPQVLRGKMSGKYLTDGTFKDVLGTIDITAEGIDDLKDNIQTFQDFINREKPHLKEIRVEVVPAMNALGQINQKISVKTVNRLGIVTEQREIASHRDDETREEVYQINETLSFNKVIELPFVSSIKMKVRFVVG